MMALMLSKIEPVLNADDQQWSRTIGYVDLKCFLRFDDDDVSITVIVRIQAVVCSTKHSSIIVNYTDRADVIISFMSGRPFSHMDAEQTVLYNSSMHGVVYSAL
jgi:hypothetical protein